MVLKMLLSEYFHVYKITYYLAHIQKKSHNRTRDKSRLKPQEISGLQNVNKIKIITTF